MLTVRTVLNQTIGKSHIKCLTLHWVHHPQWKFTLMLKWMGVLCTDSLCVFECMLTHRYLSCPEPTFPLMKQQKHEATTIAEHSTILDPFLRAYSSESCFIVFSFCEVELCVCVCVHMPVIVYTRCLVSLSENVHSFFFLHSLTKVRLIPQNVW